MAVLADLYARSAATVIGWGVQRHPCGGQNVRFIDALAWLTGNVGAPDTEVYFNLSSLRNLNLSWLPEPPNSRSLRLPLLGSDLESASPRVEAVWISGCNIVNQAPDSKRLSELFSGLDFLVVVDAFMTDTAACADLVLPCALMWEQEDVVGSSMHNFLQYATPFSRPRCTPAPTNGSPGSFASVSGGASRFPPESAASGKALGLPSRISTWTGSRPGDSPRLHASPQPSPAARPIPVASSICGTMSTTSRNRTLVAPYAC